MDNLTIECVWYQSKRDFNKFVRAIEDPQLTVIDFSIIKNKLIKSDPYSKEPNDYVIGLNIMNSFKTVMNSEKKKTTTIVYTFRDLSQDTVLNFKEMVYSYTDRDIEFVLNSLNMDEVPSRSIIGQFDFIKFIDND
jgi:hypothetical protein